MKVGMKRFLIVTAAVALVGGGMALAGWAMGGQTAVKLERDGNLLIYSPLGIRFESRDGWASHDLVRGLERLDEMFDGWENAWDTWEGGLDDAMDDLDDAMDDLDHRMDDLNQTWNDEGMTNGGIAVKMDSSKLEAFENLDVSTISAKVEVEEGADYAIQIENRSNSMQLGYSLSGGTLTVEERKTGISFINIQSNELKITVPKGVALKQVKIGTVSGKVELEPEDVTADGVTVATTSGGIKVNGIDAAEFDLSSVSGKIELEGDATGKVRAKSTSGKVLLQGDLQGEITAASVSGHVTIELEGSEGLYNYNCSSISGGIKVGGQSFKRSASGGSGSRAIKANTTSGGIDITFDHD